MAAPRPRPAPPRPGTPPAPPGGSVRTEGSETEGVPPGYGYIHTPHASAQFLNLDVYAKNRMCDKYFIPDLLAAEGPSTG